VPAWAHRERPVSEPATQAQQSRTPRSSAPSGADVRPEASPERAADRLRRLVGRQTDLPPHVTSDALRRRMLAGADALAILGSVLLAATGPLSVSQGFWTVALLPLGIVLAKLAGLYELDHRSLRHLTVDELGRLLVWVTGTTAILVALLGATPAGRPGWGGAVALWGTLAVLAPALRGSARFLWRRATQPTRVVLIGSGPLKRTTRRKLDLFHDIHAEVDGQVEIGEIQGLSVHAIEARIRAACGGRLPGRVIVCASDVGESVLANVVAVCRARRLKLSVVPPMRGMFGTAVRLTHVAELPVLEYHTGDQSRSTILLKRTADVTIAAVTLTLTLPLLALAALAIRLDSRGPILYTQLRAGLGGASFRMLKFRTMVPDADRRLAEVVALDGLTDPVFKVRNDARVTRTGRFLRRWSIDELPQLWNVLRGEMSIVGPRPEQLSMVERYAPEHRFRLEAVPGVTGPMQVFGRADLDFDERLAVEREYLENMTLGRDVRIMLLTIPAVLSGKGAF
jgi:exopolysaccharide biosynthesis polyprenyl glycosylphosphotransferase